MMDGWFQDLRYALRALARAPGTTVFAVLTFAVAIGVNTAFFTLTSAWLLRPLPYDDPDRLVVIREKRTGQPDTRSPVAPADFLSWREHVPAFEGLAAYHRLNADLTGEGEPEQIDGARASANLFSVLGVRAAAGRTFRPDDEVPGASAVAIASHAFWQRRFGAAPFAPRAIVLDGRRVEIVGVMPPGFDFPKGTALWVPMIVEPGEAALRRLHYLQTVGRLRPKVTLHASQLALDAETRRLEQELPENRGHHAAVTSLEQETAGHLRLPLLVLQAAVAFVLLLACANIATLLLARAAARQFEVAVRLALGAGRRRLARQFLVEGLVLAAAGGTAGVLAAAWLTPLVPGFLPETLQPAGRVDPDARVLAFAVGTTALAGILSALIPSVYASTTALAHTLRHDQHTGSGAGRLRLTGMLVAAEVAVAIVLLVGAGLAARSFMHLRSTDPGFRADGILTAAVSLPRSRYAQGYHVAAFYEQALERIRSLPGVSAAGAVLSLPASGSSGRQTFTIEGREATARERPIALSNVVTPDYFRTIGVPVVSGRTFTPGDARGPRVAIVNESWVRHHLPDRAPLGSVLRFSGLGGADRRVTIVGIVGDVRQAGLAVPPAPEIYLPHSQSPSSRMTLVVRTKGGEGTGVPDIRAAIFSLDRDQPISTIERLESTFERDLGEPRLRTWLMSAFGGGALALAILGLVGLVSVIVSLRVPEIGLRLALGAQPSEVRRLVVVDALRTLVIGGLIGTALALWLTRLAAGLLHDVVPTDPVVFGGVLALLAICGLVASYLPTRRITRLDPLIALRGRAGLQRQ